MDKNQATGLILIAVLLIVYLQFFSPQPTKPEDDVPQIVEEPIKEQPEEEEAPIDSLELEKLGDYASAATGEAEDIIVENENIKVTLNSYGGVVSRVQLKDFKTYDGQPLILVDEESSRFNWFTSFGNERLNLSKLHFTTSQSAVGDTAVVEFNLQAGGQDRITYRYMLPPTGYQLIHKVIPASGAPGDLSLEWTDRIKRVERDVEVSRINTTVGWLNLDEDYESLSERSEGLEEETISEPIKWVSIKQKFFSSAIISQKPFSQGYVAATVDQSTENIIKTAKVNLLLPSTNVSGGNTFTYFFGPNDYDILKNVAPEFSQNLDLGWPPMSWVNRFVIIPLFNLLNNFFDNYGMIIFVMVLIIKLVLFPLSYKSYLSMAKMKVLKPEIDEIREKSEGDQMKIQQETMKLYQSVGVNPVSGCIPLLLQMPILLAMFYFFPESIELRQESFLWADDLSTYDSVLEWDAYIPILSSIYGNHVSLFVLLMTVSTILYTWSNQQVSTVQGPMAVMSYMMPVVFLFVLNSYPAALSYYYFLSNIITFGQQWAIRKFIDDDKIREKLEENKKKRVGKKKSTFQQRLEDAMRAKQEAAQKKKNK
ncbi:MAG: membrane protein insertase YidC [Candidatus Cyclobacteriaceae bacterium M2_1C_046]